MGHQCFDDFSFMNDAQATIDDSGFFVCPYLLE